MTVAVTDDAAPMPRAIQRVALGVSYRGTRYHGWQSQLGGGTIQDALEAALSRFAVQTVRVTCAGRTDAGVHGLNQVVHLDTPLSRDPFSWVRGTNTYLPADIAVQWAVPVSDLFHARNSAIGRRYSYVLLQSPVRPSIEAGQVGWVFRPLQLQAMRDAAQYLIGQHDFSSFRSSQCQAHSPVRLLRSIHIHPCQPSMGASAGVPWAEQGDALYWRFDFEGQAFLHHMVRNIMGCLIAVGTGQYPAEWVQEVLKAKNRAIAAPTFPPDGLYFLGPDYGPDFALPTNTSAMGWLPPISPDSSDI